MFGIDFGADCNVALASVFLDPLIAYCVAYCQYSCGLTNHTGMLWSVCDTLTDEGAPAGSNVNRTSSPGGTGGTSENDRASLHSMWPAMLWELRSLSIDFRPEVMRSKLWSRL